MRRDAAAFAPDRWLQLRMAVALGLAAALTAAVLAGMAYMLTTELWGLVLFVGCFLIVGAVAAGSRAPRRRRGVRAPRQADAQRVQDIVERLCLVADLGPPMVEIERHPAPLSWTTAAPWRPARLHVTTALLDRLAPGELEAVVAHELSHLAQHDAVVMTVVAGPPVALFRGMRKMVADERVRGTLAVVCFGVWIAPVALLMLLLARLVSRQRELTADRGAAALTGSPAALAAALVAVAEGVAATPRRDLRLVAPRDPFHLLPARAREPRLLGRLWATHPRLRRRLAQLQRMEADLQRPG